MSLLREIGLKDNLIFGLRSSTCVATLLREIGLKDNLILSMSGTTMSDEFWNTISDVANRMAQTQYHRQELHYYANKYHRDITMRDSGRIIIVLLDTEAYDNHGMMIGQFVWFCNCASMSPEQILRIIADNMAAT